MTEIRDWLNDQGMKNTRGQPMSYNSAERLLKNRRYIGEFKYREALIPDGIPPCRVVILFFYTMPERRNTVASG